MCNKYCGYMADNGTIYGCADPGDPEPYDPDYFCKKCATKEYERVKDKIIKNGEGRFSCSWWIVPNFVREALNDTGYEMIRSSDNTHYSLKRK